MVEHFLNDFTESYDEIISLKEHGEATETTEASLPSSLPAVKTAFNIPLIVKKSMEYLPLSDLIACSTFNRQWYAATRTQDLRATVHQCYDLQRWHFHMTAMSRPFSILSFETGAGRCADSENVNFADMPLKKVIFSGWAFCRNICTSRRFLSQVFYMGNLQELCITTHWLESVSPTWTNLLENGQVLKNLRVLTILEREVKVESVVDLIRSLIETSPRLQYLDCYMTPKQALSAAKTKPRVIKYVTFLPPETVQDEALYEQYAQSEPKLWGLRASRSDTMGSMWMGTGVYRLSHNAWNILRRVLLSTCSTLRQLAIGSYVGEKFGQDKGLTEAVFPNLREMILDIDIPAGVESLGALEFPRVFPQLSSVIVRPEETYCINGDDPQNLNSSSITEIVLLSISSLRVIGCSRLFPYVTSLTLDDSPFEIGLLTEACQAWPRLKRFKIGDGANLSVLEPYELDSLLCGMNLSEAEKMSRKGAEYLKKVNFVRRGYSLVNLAELELVEITFAQHYCHADCGKLMTKTTPYLTLTRLPHLKFIINCFQSEANCMQPLLPLVTINIVSKKRATNFHSWKR